MQQFQCPGCSQSLREPEAFCPYCGSALPRDKAGVGSNAQSGSASAAGNTTKTSNAVAEQGAGKRTAKVWIYGPPLACGVAINFAVVQLSVYFTKPILAPLFEAQMTTFFLSLALVQCVFVTAISIRLSNVLFLAWRNLLKICADAQPPSSPQWLTLFGGFWAAQHFATMVYRLIGS